MNTINTSLNDSSQPSEQAAAGTRLVFRSARGLWSRRERNYLQTSREAKFKAKQAIDSLSWRVGDLLQAGLVFVGARLAFGVRQFALLNEVFVIFWIVVVFIYLPGAQTSGPRAGLPAQR